MHYGNILKNDPFQLNKYVGVTIAWLYIPNGHTFVEIYTHGPYNPTNTCTCAFAHQYAEINQHNCLCYFCIILHNTTITDYLEYYSEHSDVWFLFAEALAKIDLLTSVGLLSNCTCIYGKSMKNASFKIYFSNK